MPPKSRKSDTWEPVGFGPDVFIPKRFFHSLARAHLNVWKGEENLLTKSTSYRLHLCWAHAFEDLQPSLVSLASLVASATKELSPSDTCGFAGRQPWQDLTWYPYPSIVKHNHGKSHIIYKWASKWEQHEKNGDFSIAIFDWGYLQIPANMGLWYTVRDFILQGWTI